MLMFIRGRLRPNRGIRFARHPGDLSPDPETHAFSFRKHVAVEPRLSGRDIPLAFKIWQPIHAALLKALPFTCLPRCPAISIGQATQLMAAAGQGFTFVSRSGERFRAPSAAPRGDRQCAAGHV